MEIRLAKKEDFEKYFFIKEKFFEEYNISKKTREFIYKEFIGYLKKIIILAIKDNEIVGYIVGKIKENPYEKYGYISEIFVKKKNRDEKISTKLKDKFLEILKEKEIKSCRIEVNPNNFAQEIYKKWGFKIDKYRMNLNL